MARSRSKIEAMVAQFLDDLSIEYEQNKKVGRYNVDFLIGEKCIVECYGDFWHCNPAKYSADYFNRGLKCEAQERWDKDGQRQKELENMGYSMLVLWESEIKNSARHCKNKIKTLLENNYNSG